MQLGIVRRLTRLATTDGFLCIAAMDHPENYVALFDKDISRVPHETVVRSKLELATELARHASGLLLDPVWSLGQAIATRTLPGTVGLIVPIEQLRYTPQGFDLETRLRPKWTPEKIAAIGADGVKLYLSYRADIADVAAEQRKLVADLASACRAQQLPLIVEPIWYPLPGEDPTEPAVRRQRAAAIVSSAAEFGLLGVDVLKVQFPDRWSLRRNAPPRQRPRATWTPGSTCRGCCSARAPGSTTSRCRWRSPRGRGPAATSPGGRCGATRWATCPRSNAGAAWPGQGSG